MHLDQLRGLFWLSACLEGLVPGILLIFNHERWESWTSDHPMEAYIEIAAAFWRFFRGLSYWLLALTCAWFVMRLLHVGWPRASASAGLRVNLLPMLLVVLLYAALGKILRALEAVYQASQEAVREASRR